MILLTGLVTQFHFADNCLTTSIEGTYHSAPPLANITIAGVEAMPKGLSMQIAGRECDVDQLAVKHDEGGVLRITGVEQFTQQGAWEGEMEMKMWY